MLQVKDLLLPFGALKAFNLVMDKATGNSKVSQHSTAPLVPASKGLISDIKRAQHLHAQLAVLAHL